MNGQPWARGPHRRPAFIRLTTTNGRRYYLNAEDITAFGERLADHPDYRHTEVQTYRSDRGFAVCETPDEVVALLKAAGIKAFALAPGGEVEEVEP